MTAGGGAPEPRALAWVREECPVCQQVERVRADGTLAMHNLTRPPWNTCRGSGTTPASHVHRCRCGARWDEDA